MVQQTIDVGAAPNDGTGDTLRDAMVKANANFDELYGASGATINNDDWDGTDLSIANGGTGASSAAAARTNLDVYSKAEVDGLVAGGGSGGDTLCPTFNFTDTGEARFYAYEAMTLTEQSTSGAGTIAYEKSTSAAPDAFSGTSSPITLEAGAWLKVSASAVIGIVAVALARTA